MKMLLLLQLSLPAYASTTIVLIGGGKRPVEALKVLLDAKKAGPVVVLPWGTGAPLESFANIKKELQDIAPVQVECLCDETTDLTLMKNAGALYFPGGDQNKIMKRILSENLKPQITEMYQSGIPVGGTSAGTAIQTDPMLTGVESETAEGLGLLPYYIVDQHYLVRRRENRLVYALDMNPTLSGVGVDEDMS
ncbi:MAG: cyanophycinase, partial [Bacteroidota bacterium]